MLADIVELTAPDISTQASREERQVMQCDRNRDAVGRGRDANFHRQAAILIASRMICHGASSRCMISDSADGSNCGVCKGSALSAAIAPT